MIFGRATLRKVMCPITEIIGHVSNAACVQDENVLYMANISSEGIFFSDSAHHSVACCPTNDRLIRNVGKLSTAVCELRR